MMTDLDKAVETARHALSIDRDLCVNTHGYVIIDVPAVGPNGGHYAPGCRVYSDVPQAPGGIFPPGELPPGPIVAIVDKDGNVRTAQ